MRQYIIIVIVLLFILNVWLFPKEETLIHEDTTAPIPTHFEVDLTGAVVFPGKYRFFEPTTLDQVVKYAGGFLPDAHLGNLHLAERIDKNRQFHIELEQQEVSPIIQKINVNQASFNNFTGNTLYD
jgi:DNA uptake protein ComE-like DNA-binding protein